MDNVLKAALIGAAGAIAGACIAAGAQIFARGSPPGANKRVVWCPVTGVASEPEGRELQ